MQKSVQKKSEIYAILQDNPGISSVQIAQMLRMSRIAIYQYLRGLVQTGILEKNGNGKNTRYSIRKSQNILLDETNIEKKVGNLLSKSIGKKKHLAKDAQGLIYVIMPDGESRAGFEGIFELLKRERKGKEPTQDEFIKAIADFFITFADEESKRRKNGFFDGTESLEQIMKKYHMPRYIDHLYFTQLSSISRFGRLRTACEIGLGKDKSNSILIRRAILRNIEPIIAYLRKTKPDTIIFTPPTIARKVQFRDILREELANSGIVPPIISVEKRTEAHREFQPQKQLRGEARIINARESIIVTAPETIDSYKSVVIFDDNFTTGATINAIGKKLRSQGFTGQIIAITITGNFHYVPGVTDAGDI